MAERAAVGDGARDRRGVGRRGRRRPWRVADHRATPDAPAATPPSADTAPPTTEALGDPNGCNELVWDPSGQLGSSSAPAIAAERLRAAGFDVHVRVEPAVDGTIDNRQRQLEQVCAGWVIDGSRSSSLLVVAVVPLLRQTGVYYGSRGAPLDSSWRTIQTGLMNPSFRNGDYAGGLAKGLDAVDALLVRGQAPPVSTFVNPSASDDGDGSGNGGGGGSSAGFWVLVILGLLVVVGIIGVSYASGHVAGESFGDWWARTSSERRSRQGSRSSSGASWSSGSSHHESHHDSGGGSSHGGGSDSGSSGGGSTSW